MLQILTQSLNAAEKYFESPLRSFNHERWPFTRYG